MRKAAHPLGGVGSSNPHLWRGEQLYRHGDGVYKVDCAFCAVLQLVTPLSGSSYVKHVRQHNLKMRIMVLLYAQLQLAPYQKLVKGDITCGFALPLLVNKISSIPGVLL
jgi:hypothetical protein